jgi:hypothetical protein
VASGFPDRVPAWYTGPSGEHVHDVGPTAERPDREPAADDLAERREVGGDAVVALGPGRAQPQTGDDLVEHEQGADAVALGAEPREEPLDRRHQAHVGRDRFDDDAGDVVPQLGHDVVGGHDGVLDRVRGDPGRAGQPQHGDAAAALDEQRVGVPVVVAGELHHLGLARVAAGDADGGHRGLGAAADEAHLVDARDALDHGLGEQDLALGGCAVGRAVSGGLPHGIDHPPDGRGRG